MSESPRSRIAFGVVLLLSLVALTACGNTSVPAETTTEQTVVEPAMSADETDAPPPSAEGSVASVYADPVFEVRITEDVVYAQGLSHESPNSEAAVEMDLLLDVYEPVRSDDVTMPAVVMIHGGGFTGGSKQTRWIEDMAPWFASRGWVVYSVDYRVTGDLGTIPADYPAVPEGANRKQADQWRALYPACRDAKAAIRWVHATADEYSIEPDHIAVIGGSAGSVLAVTLGASDEGDCTDEVSVEEDPTLLTTNLDQSSEVATVIDHWGGTAILTALELMDGIDRFDSTDAPVSIVHGTEDPTVLFAEAETIRAEYERTGVTYEWNPLVGRGHGVWEATIDGQSLTESAADFIIETQSLQVD